MNEVFCKKCGNCEDIHESMKQWICPNCDHSNRVSKKERILILTIEEQVSMILSNKLGIEYPCSIHNKAIYIADILMIRINLGLDMTFKD
jgi:acetyl-CoA carboxylase beta subunit